MALYSVTADVHVILNILAPPQRKLACFPTCCLLASNLLIALILLVQGRSPVDGRELLRKARLEHQIILSHLTLKSVNVILYLKRAYLR